MRRRRRHSAPLIRSDLLPASVFEAKAIDALDRMMFFMLGNVYHRGGASDAAEILSSSDRSRTFDHASHRSGAGRESGCRPCAARSCSRDARSRSAAANPLEATLGTLCCSRRRPASRAKTPATHGRGILSSPAWWGRPVEAGICRAPEAITAVTPASYRPATSLRRRWDGTASTSASERIEKIFRSQMKNAEALEQLSASLGVYLNADGKPIKM